MIQILVSIALIGLLAWALTTLIPMPEPFKKAIYVVCVVGLALYVLNAFGLWHGRMLR